jgi:hypothetical protein
MTRGLPPVCPYRAAPLRAAWHSGRAQYLAPRTSPLRGVIDADRPKGERDAFARGWRAQRAYAETVGAPASTLRAQDRPTTTTEGATDPMTTTTPTPEVLALREKRARAVLAQYPHDVGQTLDDLRELDGEPVARFLGVAEDGDDYWINPAGSFEDCAAYLADEVLGEVSWLPVAVFDLDEGTSIPIGVRVEVVRTEDHGGQPDVPWADDVEGEAI